MASWHTSLFDDVGTSPEGNPSEPSGNSGQSSKSGPQADSHERQHIRLACQACQRKKIKCDRFYPCGQCTRSNLSCVASSRKPRARHTGKRALDSELRNRISKLEGLVESLSGEVAAGSTSGDTPEKDENTNDNAASTGEQPSRKPSVAVEKYMGSQFWSSLTNEVQALRDALEEDPGEAEDDDTTPSTSTSGPSNSAEYDLLVCPPGAVYVMPGALNEPTQELSATLCSVFCENVDDLFKMFHQPSLRNFMINGAPYLGQDPSAPNNKTVKAAVWFSAVNTLSDGDCRKLFGQSRPDALQHFKRIVDVSLAQADLMNTSDVATLQAFTTYLAASRLTDPGRRMWTLMSVAVRIAKAMGLHREGQPRSPYMTEVRRRLFHQVRFLDAYCCLDRGSEGLVTPGSFDTPHPHNVNDSEFDADSPVVPNHDKMLTDQSFALLAYAATERTHLLFIPEDKSGATWQQRLEMAEQFEREIHEKYIGLCDRKKPFQRMMFHVGSGMVASMKLRAVRPVQKHVSSVPPRVDSPYVLGLALDTLTASEAILSDPDTSQWRWMIWVPWHGLAVTLAGLCSVRDTTLANKAWQAVEASYARNLRFIAEGRHGMLWRPIEKLYRKASAFRDHRENEPSSTTASPQAKGQQPPFGPMGVAYPITSTTTNTDSTTNANTNTNAPINSGLFGQQPLPQQPLPTGSTPLNHNDLPHGSMPTSGVPNTTNMNMDFDFTLSPGDFGGGGGMNLDSDLDFRNGDISWMDFERILEDMEASTTGGADAAGVLGGVGGGMGGVGGGAGGVGGGVGGGGVVGGIPAEGAEGVSLGDVQWPANVSQGQSWGCNLHQDLM